MRKLLILIGMSLLCLIGFVQPINKIFAAAPTNPAITKTTASQPTNLPFLTGPHAGDPLTIATNYLHEQATPLGLDEADLVDLVVKDHYITQHNGVTQLYFRQRYRGIEVFNGDININISRQGEVLNVGNRFVPHLARAINTDVPTLTAREAVGRAAARC